MAFPTLRATKGSELTWAEVDANFSVPTTGTYYVAASGATMDGSTDDGTVIAAWLATLPTNCNVVWPAGKTIVSSISFGVQSGQTHYGYGCTLKRKNEVTTTITGSSFASGANLTITVASTTGFLVGQTISVGKTDRSHVSLLSKISSINPGVSLTLATTVQDAIGSGNYVSGDTVATKMTFFTDINGLGIEIGPVDVKILGFQFDGNGANNSSIIRWETTFEIYIDGSTTARLLIADCTFKNAPGEGIIANAFALKLDKLWFYWPASVAYGGNPIHLSGSGSTVFNDFSISNIFVKNSHQTGTNAGHQNGVITSSVDCQYGVISNVTAEGCLGLAGPLNVAAKGWQFLSCICKTASGYALTIASGGVGLSFNNCYFEDCVDTVIGTCSDIKFANCHWENTTITADTVTRMFMSNCTMNSASTTALMFYLGNCVDCTTDVVVAGGNVGMEVLGTSTVNVTIKGTVKNQLGSNPKGVYISGTPSTPAVTVSVNVVQLTGVAASSVNGVFISGAANLTGCTWRMTTGARCIYWSNTDPLYINNCVFQNANVSQYPIETGAAVNGSVIKDNQFMATDNGVSRWIYFGGGTVTKSVIQGNVFYVGGSSYTVDVPTSVKGQYLGNIWGYKAGGNPNTVTNADPLWINSTTTDQISGNLMRSAP